MTKQKRYLQKGTALILSLLLLLGSLASCGGKSGESIPSSGENASSTASSSTPSDGVRSEDAAQFGEEDETDLPGNYIVPEGWVKMEQYSTEDKIFYTEEGHEEDKQPDNISVEVKTNRYSAEDHMKFRDAIVRQLTMQAAAAGADLTGAGTFTDHEDVLYIFTITEEDVVTKQFYIVGDKRYCLIHLTNFTGSESADEAAQAMADSFTWD